MPFEQPPHEKIRFSKPDMWSDDERPEGKGQVENSSVKETEEQEIARRLGRKEEDIHDYLTGRDR